MEPRELNKVVGGKQLILPDDLSAIHLTYPSIPVLGIVSKDHFDPYALATIEAFNKTWGSHINPQAIPELLRRFKTAVSMLSEYMAEANDAPQNDYNELEGFENMIKRAEFKDDPADAEREIERSVQYQVNSAINVCNGRIESGANVQEAFGWLQEEIDQVFEGKILYEGN